jgi:nucleotide-binding universal stress UspA family protein
MSGLIPVATDLSPRSARALARAQQLAAEHDASISILHVLDQSLPKRLLTSFSEQIQTELLQQALHRSRLHRFDATGWATQQHGA